MISRCHSSNGAATKKARRRKFSRPAMAPLVSFWHRVGATKEVGRGSATDVPGGSQTISIPFERTKIKNSKIGSRVRIAVAPTLYLEYFQK